ncbi:glucuronate isomerase [Sneathia sanguinegens]|uniref:glucuronate isomerase n=1 Tax=Sneathia sanguinegens TaxID=40543 RepID=UPI002582C1DD|nr:glucuronate isomerase [Sneathia sanguinegens]MDU4653064.1 glucuronate isomerase [Sneathia sanguinegens]MDU7497424.1 glucuronate isomerase [Sneathia sanguinegens]
MKLDMEKFMLNSELANKLYTEYAKDIPIYDYHCHLDPKEIYEDKEFSNISKIWLNGDHYKWRAMRANGIREEYITGDKTDYEKFYAWASTLDKCILNPLYHWNALELKRYFNIDEILTSKNANVIWDAVNSIKYSPRKLIEISNVNTLCTTDSPISDLKYHKLIRESNFKTNVLPGFRPDEALSIGKSKFYNFINQIPSVVGYEIKGYEDLVRALSERIKYFDENGTCVCDHGLTYMPFEKASLEEVKEIFKKALNKEELSEKEVNKYLTRLLVDLSKEYKKYDWTMQIHFGAIRDNNKKYFEKLGYDTGFDSITDDTNLAYKLNGLLNEMVENDSLPKMIIYNLNPMYNDLIASTIANFQINNGNMQFGAAWWFNDTKEGMLKQMKCLANNGLFSKFVGMLTDSRSFLSYTRHDYFRRILCDFIADLVEKNEIPKDMDMLKELIQNICYYNAKRYFEKRGR